MRVGGRLRGAFITGVGLLGWACQPQAETNADAQPEAAPTAAPTPVDLPPAKPETAPTVAKPPTVEELREVLIAALTDAADEINRTGDRAELILVFERLTAIDPTNAWAHLGLGIARHDLGQTEPAVASLRAAVELAPDDAYARALLGWFLTNDDKVRDGLEECDAAIAIDATVGRAHTCRGTALLKSERLVAAQRAFRAATELEPDSRDAWNGLGRVLERRGRVLEALYAYDKALEGDFDDTMDRTDRERASEAMKPVRVEAATKATHGDYRETRAMDAKTLAAALESRASDADGLQDLVHPRLGVFVVHNTAGSVPHIDRVTRWPHGDYDYSMGLDETRALEVLRDARRLMSPAPEGGAAPAELGTDPERDDECAPPPDGFYEASVPVFDQWMVVCGIAENAALEWYELTSWDRFRDACRYVEDDLKRWEFAKMQQASLAITTRVFVDGAQLELGSIGGQWYLLAVGVIDDACG